ncbi:MAG TPA: riboflavin biosynthesis protein RibD, partial [Rubrivivax sp.]|nr:riboflavin biosynthesis protein RibD [Rubrivivax sp.]
MPLSESDHRRLHEALSLARRAIGLSEPNPRVGCVIAAADGRVLASGFTQQAGGPHAEAAALARSGEHTLNS